MINNNFYNKECTRSSCPEVKAGEWLRTFRTHLYRLPPLTNTSYYKADFLFFLFSRESIDYILHIVDSATAMLKLTKHISSLGYGHWPNEVVNRWFDKSYTARRQDDAIE